MPVPRPALPPRLLLTALLCAGSATAQQPVAPSTPPPVAAAPRAEPGEPAVQRITLEDEQAVIEELRVRGQTQRAVVRSKLPAVRPYEILTPVDGRDPSTAARGATGQRVWQVLDF